MKYEELDLPYGNAYVKAHIPVNNLKRILTTKHVKGLSNEREEITASLRSPIASLPLLDRINKDDKVVVLVTDNTRPCPDDRLLPPILTEIEHKLSRDNITIIVALGLHPALDRNELIELLGLEIIENYNVVNHDVNDTVHIGTTSNGTPVDINKRVVEADFRISTGFIEPHFFAGFSGGRKSIAPGVFSVRSAYINHSYKMIEHPCTRDGILDGNLLHADLLEQSKMARLDFIVNVLLNKQREITHVVSGDPVKAHEKGCELSREIVGVRVDSKADITITTNSGAPLDLDLYQSCKGMYTASKVTRDGGIVIIAAACNAGIGPESFRELHASVKRPIEVLQKIKREQPIGVQWQNQVLAVLQLRNDIYMVSELEHQVLRDMMIVPVNTVDEGLKKAFSILGDDAEITVIPEGPLILPLLSS
jgi:nickel-dependent lactate racemase